MLSTLLVVGVISHLWCAARLVGIAHHSFYSVSLHYFHSYTILNRVDFSHLSDEIPDNSTIHDLKNVALSLQPTALDDQILQNNISTLISLILCNRMEFFKVCFQDIIQWHIKHKYSTEMSSGKFSYIRSILIV